MNIPKTSMPAMTKDVAIVLIRNTINLFKNPPKNKGSVISKYYAASPLNHMFVLPLKPVFHNKTKGTQNYD